MSDSIRVGDWMNLNCGDHVRERDGCHVGRVEAIHHGAIVKIRWLDTRWISLLPLGEVVRIIDHER